MCSKVCKTVYVSCHAGRSHMTVTATSTPSRCFLRKWTIQRLADSKSVSARNECNYVAYTSQLAVLSLQTNGQVHQARLLRAVAQFRSFGMQGFKTRRRGSAAERSRASSRPSPQLTTTDVPSGFDVSWLPVSHHPEERSFTSLAPTIIALLLHACLWYNSLPSLYIWLQYKLPLQ